MDNEFSLKPMFAAVLTEALRHALVDCAVAPPRSADDADIAAYQDRKIAAIQDPYVLTAEEWGGIDWKALAQNLGCRLMGGGGWTVNGIYAGNATARDLFEASFARPDGGGAKDVEHLFAGSGFDVTPISSVEELRELEKKVFPKDGEG